MQRCKCKSTEPEEKSLEYSDLQPGKYGDVPFGRREDRHAPTQLLLNAPRNRRANTNTALFMLRPLVLLFTSAGRQPYHQSPDQKVAPTALIVLRKASGQRDHMDRLGRRGGPRQNGD